MTPGLTSTFSSQHVYHQVYVSGDVCQFRTCVASSRFRHLDVFRSSRTSAPASSQCTLRVRSQKGCRLALPCWQKLRCTPTLDGTMSRFRKARPLHLEMLASSAFVPTRALLLHCGSERSTLRHEDRMSSWHTPLVPSKQRASFLSLHIAISVGSLMDLEGVFTLC